MCFPYALEIMALMPVINVHIMRLVGKLPKLKRIGWLRSCLEQIEDFLVEGKEYWM